MKYKIYIAGVWGIGNVSILRQFRDDEEVIFLENDYQDALRLSKVWRFLQRRLGGAYVAKALRWLLGHRMWDNKYALEHCSFARNCHNYVIIFNSALLHYYSKGFFERLKMKYDIKLVLYIIDPMPTGLWDVIEAVRDEFDYIFSMHLFNCKKYGFEYLPYMYTRINPQNVSYTGKESVLYFCGVMDEYRQKIIKGVVAGCNKYDVSYEFWVKPTECANITGENIHYAELSYEDNVQKLLHVNCLLEIMHEGYEGITQRYLEAVVYNKKLLTNNPCVKKLSYYSSQYVQYFEKVDEIDWNWVLDDIKVDYKYRGDFSPEVWKNNLLRLVGEI